MFGDIDTFSDERVAEKQSDDKQEEEGEGEEG